MTNETGLDPIVTPPVLRYFPAPFLEPQVDPETRQLITRNSLQLGIVANQMQNLGAQMQSLTGSLQVIGNSLAAQSQLERQKEEQEAQLQNKLAQQKLREGKESVIEKKIQAAALAPANKIAAKAQFTLSRLGSFFTSIFGGWLLMKGIDTLSALATGNKDELNKIKNETITGLLVAGGALAAIKIAFLSPTKRESALICLFIIML